LFTEEQWQCWKEHVEGELAKEQAAEQEIGSLPNQWLGS